MSQSSTTIESALAEAVRIIAEISDTPRLDAEALLAWSLGVPRSYLITHAEEALRNRPSSDFSDALERRKEGEPIAYIIGTKEFWSLPFNVSNDTLVPRPETETLVEQAIRQIPQGHACRVLDLGTGCGAIAIAIASERPNIEIVATDSSSRALLVAKENAAQNSLNNIRFLEGNWTEPVADQIFDIIVSNPPYVCEHDPALVKLRYEPRSALAAGTDGLDAIRKIARESGKLIAENGTLLLEHGADQQDAVEIVLRENGWSDIECFKDLSGHPRVTRARMSTPPHRNQP